MNYNFFNSKREQIFLFMILFYVFTLGVSYFCISDISVLATSWIKDDAYYYFKTARLFIEYQFFTFDGINLTYGFQPLYELFLIPLAFFVSDKIIFIKIILIISLFLYLVSSYIIYLLGQDLLGKKWALIPSLIWLCNIDLINVFTSGMENSVSVLLLLLTLFIIKKDKLNLLSILTLGLLSGLLILTRVNMIFTLPVLFTYLFIRLRKYNSRYSFISIIGYLLSAVITVLPWLLYSIKNFSSLLPNSGTRKLVGAFAGLLRSIDILLSKDVINLALRFFPGYESILYHSNVDLIYPSLGNFTYYIFNYIPALVFSLGNLIIVKEIMQSHTLIIFAVNLIFIATILTLIFIFGTKIKQPKISSCFYNTNYHPIIILSVISFINISLNGLLLPTWLKYYTWYNFPEVILCLFTGSFIIKALHSEVKIKIKNSFLEKKTIYIALIIFSIPFLSLIFRFYPNTIYNEEPFLLEEWKAKEWINSNIKDAKIGAWSAGILGYFTNEDVTVINLDGLANSPEFTETFYSNYILYQKKLTDSNMMWDYIKKMQINYIADADFISNKGLDYFLWTVPPENYNIIYESGEINWNETNGKRNFKIIKLNY